MTIVMETNLHRQDTRRTTGSVMSQLKHGAGICTIAGSFTFLFALVTGLN
ncbi:hypothetical protein AMC90_PD00800 (plasmid) [Rhizobium phaseoli]|nr:hypothetical protein [Rhizobium phaseoli]ANL31825.1 hypothetical protein AMC90_PD00800 [Rhizobium phaseoli]ARM16239.1 hypothetical protein Bra5_PD00698 [Rhizobium phaseoli Brasil 5]